MTTLHHQKVTLSGSPTYGYALTVSLSCVLQPDFTMVLRDQMKLGFRPVTVDTNAPDEEGCLVFADNRLVAVLVRLSAEHGKKAGRWYLEHGFGKLDGPAHPIFTDLNEARDWVAQRVG